MDLGLDQFRALKKAIGRQPSTQLCASTQIVRGLSHQLQSRSREIHDALKMPVASRLAAYPPGMFPNRPDISSRLPLAP